MLCILFRVFKLHLSLRAYRVFGGLAPECPSVSLKRYQIVLVHRRHMVLENIT